MREERRPSDWLGWLHRAEQQGVDTSSHGDASSGAAGLAPHGRILSWSCDPELLLRSFPRAWNATPCSQYSFQFSVDFPSRGVTIHTLLVIPAPGNEC